MQGNSLNELSQSILNLLYLILGTRPTNTKQPISYYILSFSRLRDAPRLTSGFVIKAAVSR